MILRGPHDSCGLNPHSDEDLLGKVSEHAGDEEMAHQNYLYDTIFSKVLHSETVRGTDMLGTHFPISTDYNNL